MLSRTRWLTALCLLATARPVAAQVVTYTFTGANSQPGVINDPVDWSNPFNWAGNSVPPNSNNQTILEIQSAPAGLSNNNLGTFKLNFLRIDVATQIAGGPLDLFTSSVVGSQIVLEPSSPISVIIANNLIADGADIFIASGTSQLTVSGQISGSGGVHAAFSSGLTILSHSNTYTGTTTIDGGTLRTAAAGALPTGTNVAATEGTLDLNGFSASIGTLGLGSSTTFHPTVTTGSGTLTLGGDVTYTGGSNTLSGQIMGNLNLGGATRTFNISSRSGQTYDLVVSAVIGGTGGIVLDGASGIMALDSVSTYTGPTTVKHGILLLGAANALPSGTAVTLSNSGAAMSLNPGTSFLGVTAGNYNQSIGSLTGVSGTAVYLGAATLTVGNDNTSTTFAGQLLNTGALVKVGTGTLTLSGTSNNYSGGTTVTSGVLAVGNDASLGLGAATVYPAGTLRYTANATTGRTFNLNGGTLEAPAGATITYAGATVNGGFLRGTGTHAFGGNSAVFDSSTQNSSTIAVTGPATFTNFSNGGAYNIAAGLTSPVTFNGFINQGSGAISVGAASAVNASDFQTYGLLTLNPGPDGNHITLLTNTGFSPLFFNGGSRTFIGTPQTASQFLAGIDLHGQNAVVAGGLLVNNGFVADSSNNGAGTATVIADFGSLVKGAGFFQNTVITQNGGKFQAGNSPGLATFGSFVLGPGGVNNYVFAINDATGAAGPSPDANGQVSGWGLVRTLAPPRGGPGPNGDFTWTATATDRLTVDIDTLVNPTAVGTDIAGPMADFDPSRSYVWPAVQWSGSYSGPTDAAVLNADTSFDTSGVVNPIAGTFGWSLRLPNQTLSLVYTPTAVPEPGTMGLVGLAMAGWVWRRNSRRPG